MNRIQSFCAAGVVLSLLSPVALAQAPVHYGLEVILKPSEHHIAVTAQVGLPEELGAAGAQFQLNENLTILSSVPEVEPTGVDQGHLKGYRLKSAALDGVVRLSYAGALDHGLSDQKEEYTRGFRETLGILGDEGVYLSGSSGWIPSFSDGLITFELDLQSVPGWHVISQGNGTSGDGDGHATWDSGGELEQVYLVGGALHRWSESAGAIEALAYLHADEEPVATKYLDATSRYIEMYRSLIGPYPYEKFALVENFWETGYGMPSFTLLGEQIIRFPFILHSSYPHEILHNWWGNSVFVDYGTGNWCEGLTAYMADHLIQEQRGAGALYRRGTLQKYRDYVKEGRDFPLQEFTSRHDGATEAVGYGKSSMGFHMLRQQMGDTAFAQGLADFYRANRGKRASFDDIRVSLEGRVDSERQEFFDEQDLDAFFVQWLTRSGAPKLALADLQFAQAEQGYEIRLEIEQVQAAEPFALRLPIAVDTDEGVVTFVMQMRERQESFRALVAGRPLSVSLDPEFDVFRLLDPLETPPSIGQVFGEPRILALLPSAADESERARYRGLLESWQTPDHQIEIVSDAALSELPADRAVWILGANNLHARHFAGWRERARVIDVGGNPLLTGAAEQLAGHSTIVMARHPQNNEKAIGWIVVDPPAAFEGFGRKLPHYGKYSYLAFQGDEPSNVLKGQWNADDSPLVGVFEGGAARPLALATRSALADLPPVFSQRALREHVAWLAAPERQGRVPGSTGLEASADYIAEAFEGMGLEPAGDEGGWFQEFTIPAGPDGTPIVVRNVIGLMRGTKDDWKEQSVVLSAHYDHLGTGWPDTRKEDMGKLHPGANDNASGVSVMLELVRNMANAGAPSRNLLVIAFSAEECGLLGSRHYVEHPVLPLEGIRGVINIDTVGSLGNKPLAFHGTGTADEWQHIFRGCGFVTGIASKNVPAGAEGSDQWSFIEKGVPAVQVVTGAELHYHRPSDTLENVDIPGLVKVATFLKEALVYVLEREEPMNVTIEGIERAPSPNAGKRRGVSFGSIPEYGFTGGGMRLDGVSPGSPAEAAGLKEGDILIAIDDTEIASTREFAEVLKTLVPDQTVQARVLRDGEEMVFGVTVKER